MYCAFTLNKNAESNYLKQLENCLASVNIEILFTKCWFSTSGKRYPRITEDGQMRGSSINFQIADTLNIGWLRLVTVCISLWRRVFLALGFMGQKIFQIDVINSSLIFHPPPSGLVRVNYIIYVSSDQDISTGTVWPSLRYLSLWMVQNYSGSTMKSTNRVETSETCVSNDVNSTSYML